MKRTETLIKVFLPVYLVLSAMKLQGQITQSSVFHYGLNSGTESPIAEAVFLHIDRNKYVAGEDIWFSIYDINRETCKLTGMSVVAHVELLNPWSTPVVRTRFRMTGGRGEGIITIPDSISSGRYTIRAYTSFMKNYLQENWFMHDIDIYNPFKDPVQWQVITRDKSSGIAQAGIEGPLKILTDSVIGRREKVTLRINTGNDQKTYPGNPEMSISVAIAEASDTCSPVIDPVVTGPITERYIPENEGHYFTMKIKYRDGKDSDSSDFLFMSVQGKVAEFRYASADSAGRYTFTLPVDSKLRTMILQPDNASKNMSLEIEPSFSDILPDFFTQSKIMSDSLLEAFSALSFNFQASRIYGISFKRVAETDDAGNLKKRRFYGIPEMEILLDDYIKLPTMQEVFFELVPGILLRPGKAGYEIKITNPLTGVFYEEPPLVMIDGVIINDLTVLVDLDPELVEKVEVVKTPYLIGDLILHGIVNIITRAGDFSKIIIPEYAVILPYRVVENTSVFVSPEYPDDKIRPSRKPDLRNTLYWNPSVKTNKDGEAEIEFWTSDLPGIYTIKIQGISGTGKLLSSSKSFRVK